jgi:hypothetical protein
MTTENPQEYPSRNGGHDRFHGPVITRPATDIKSKRSKHVGEMAAETAIEI